jgi:hypothetical protein
MRRFWYGMILALPIAGAAGRAESMTGAAPAAEQTLIGAASGGDDPPADATVVTDVDGKEYKLTGVTFATGTRRLSWLADPKGANDDAKKGPLALELREPNSTTLVKGVVTLVPVASLESAKYDYEKQVVSLGVKGLKEPLTGFLGFQGINVLGFRGTSGGKAAAFSGGVLSKTAVKTATFAGAQPLSKPKGGKTWNIQIIQPKADNPTLTARNLKVLYAFPGGFEQLVEGIPVRKGTPIPFDETLKRFEPLADDPNRNFSAAEVEAGGMPERVIAIPLTLEQDKKAGTLVGILGEVDAGWKLFPLHTIKVIKPSLRKIE